MKKIVDSFGYEQNGSWEEQKLDFERAKLLTKLKKVHLDRKKQKDVVQ